MLMQHLRELSYHYALWIDDYYTYVIVRILLPPGYHRRATKILIEIPDDYPLSPPGIGNNRVYVRRGLTYRRRDLIDVHPEVQPYYDTPGFGPWAWFCYRTIKWDPDFDTLITFVEMIRADLTKPPTIKDTPYDQ